MRIGALFAGMGGLEMGVQSVLGGSVAWVSDIDPGACKILAHHHPDVPNLGDITKVDWAAVEPVDVLTGGFPCQDLSHAGKRAGMTPDSRSGLWTHMAYAVEQLRPRYMIAENVRGLLSGRADSDVEPCPWCMGDGTDEPPLRALGAVLGDLADIGYDARWVGLRAADVGAPHGRFRVFVVATDATSNAWRVGDRDDRSTSDAAGDAGLRSVARTDQRDIPHGDGQGARPAAHPADERHERAGSARRRGRGLADGGLAAADAASTGDGGEPRILRCSAVPNGGSGTNKGRLGGAVVGPRAADTERTRGRDRAVAWGAYEPAIRRWERVLGRPAPEPTLLSARGSRQLSPLLVEWMMGLPEGHVTGVPGLTRNAMLKALGNGVVPQQAAAALRWLLAGEAGGMVASGALLSTPKATNNENQPSEGYQNLASDLQAVVPDLRLLGQREPSLARLAEARQPVAEPLFGPDGAA